VNHVQANGLRFAYLTQGQGPLVLLLHGFPDTAHTWDATLPALAAAGFRAVAPFLRGYHPTEIPPDGRYDTDTLGRDALALIEALGETRAIVVGHDWGAAAAYSATVLGPERVPLVVVVGTPHPRSILPTPLFAWKVRHFFTLKRKNAAAKLRANDLRMVDVFVRRWSPTWDASVDALAPVKAALSEPGGAEAAVAYYRALPLRVAGALARPIPVPAVAFAGEHDPIVKPRQYEKARRWFTASYEVVKMPGGHFMHCEHPARFTTELVRVLEAHRASWA
jgi:pimeloyl-ACP methyl ester carboxylesterase